LATTVVPAGFEAGASAVSAGFTVEATMTGSQHDGVAATQYSFTTR
jgi:hypothetical protein